MKCNTAHLTLQLILLKRCTSYLNLGFFKLKNDDEINKRGAGRTLLRIAVYYLNVQPLKTKSLSQRKSQPPDHQKMLRKTDLYKPNPLIQLQRALRRHQQLNHIIATNLGKALVNGSVFDTVMLHTRAAHEDITAFLDKGF